MSTREEEVREFASRIPSNDPPPVKTDPLNPQTMEQGRELVRMMDAGEVAPQRQEEARAALTTLKTKLETPNRANQNFFERFGDDLHERFGEQGSEIIAAQLEGDQGYASTALQLTGKVAAGTVLDLIGEVIVSGGRGLSNITPDAIEDPLKEGVTVVGHKILATDLGQKGLEAAMNGLESYQEFADENPVMARNIEALVNVGLLVAPVKGKPKVPGAPPNRIVQAVKKGKEAIAKSPLGQAVKKLSPGVAGDKIIKSGVKQKVANKQKLAEDLVRTPQTKVVREMQALDQTTMGGGLLNTAKVAPTKFEAAMAKVVAKLPVSTRNTVQGNLNIIRGAATKEVKRLAAKLKKMPNQSYFFGELKAELGAARASITNTITGDAGKMAGDLIKQFEKIARGKKPTLSNLLKARKELDKWIKTQKKNAFSPDSENALSVAVQAVRRTTNDFIAARAPSAGVKRSLDRSWKLFSASENLSKEAAKMAGNRVTRSLQNVIKLLPFRSEFNNIMAAVFGLGGLGASTMFAPWFTKLAIGAGVSYIGGKAIMHPLTRIGLGKSLKLIDQALRKTTDPHLLRQMRADRAFIVELVRASDNEE